MRSRSGVAFITALSLFNSSTSLASFNILSRHNGTYTWDNDGAACKLQKNNYQTQIGDTFNDFVDKLRVFGKTSEADSCSMSNPYPKSLDIIQIEKEATDLINEDSYKYIDWTQINDLVEEAAKHIQEAINARDHHKRRIMDARFENWLKLGVSKIARGAIFDGPSGLAGRATAYSGKYAIRAGFAGYDWLKSQVHETTPKAPSPPKKIKLDALVPMDSGNLRVLVKAFRGVAKIGFGAASIAVSAAAPGVGSVVVSSVGTGVNMALYQVQRQANNTKKRRKILNKVIETTSTKKGPNSRKGTLRFIGSTASTGAKSLTSKLMVQQGGAAVSDAVTAGMSIMPIIGGVYSITSGFKGILEAAQGGEKQLEVVLAYETYYKKIVEAVLDKRIEDTENLIKRTQVAMTPPINKSTSESAIRLTDQLCRTLKWLKDFKKKTSKKFSSRIAFLQRSLKVKNFSKKARDLVWKPLFINDSKTEKRRLDNVSRILGKHEASLRTEKNKVHDICTKLKAISEDGDMTCDSLPGAQVSLEESFILQDSSKLNGHMVATKSGNEKVERFNNRNCLRYWKMNFLEENQWNAFETLIDRFDNLHLEDQLTTPQELKAYEAYQKATSKISILKDAMDDLSDQFQGEKIECSRSPLYQRELSQALSKRRKMKDEILRRIEIILSGNLARPQT
jgi:hypothetical protein